MNNRTAAGAGHLLRGVEREHEHRAKVGVDDLVEVDHVRLEKRLAEHHPVIVVKDVNAAIPVHRGSHEHLHDRFVVRSPPT